MTCEPNHDGPRGPDLACSLPHPATSWRRSPPARRCALSSTSPAHASPCSPCVDERIARWRGGSSSWQGSTVRTLDGRRHRLPPAAEPCLAGAPSDSGHECSPESFACPPNTPKMWVSRERIKVATRDRFAGLDGALDARLPSNDDPACSRDVCATAGSELPNMQPGSMPRRPDGTGSSSRSRVARVAAVGLWAVACASPEVQLVPAPEWPAPAARGAFVGIFDADGALTVYPHKPGGANPMPWVPHTQPLSVAAGVVEQIYARTPPGGITWLPVPEATNSLRVTLNVWRWEAFREDAWGVPEEFTAWFVPSRQACPRFRVEPVGVETEPSTTASRRLTTLTAGAVASIPEDWRLPSPPSYRVWNAEGLGPTIEGTAPMWSCAARGLRLLIDGTRYATLVDDAAPWPIALSDKKILAGPTGVNRFGPCVALKDGWGAVTADGSGFFRLAEKGQVRRVTLEFQDT